MGFATRSRQPKDMVFEDDFDEEDEPVSPLPIQKLHCSKFIIYRSDGNDFEEVLFTEYYDEAALKGIQKKKKADLDP